MNNEWLAVDAARYDALYGKRLGDDFLVLQTEPATWTVHAIMRLDEDGFDGLEEIQGYPTESEAMGAAEQMLSELSGTPRRG